MLNVIVSYDLNNYFNLFTILLQITIQVPVDVLEPLELLVQQASLEHLETQEQVEHLDNLDLMDVLVCIT